MTGLKVEKAQGIKPYLLVFGSFWMGFKTEVGRIGVILTCLRKTLPVINPNTPTF
jgi:hypothetical protein